MGEISPEGQVYVDGLLDAADARDMEDAVAREAEVLRRCGDDSSLDMRRAKAVGVLARRYLALDLLIADEETGEVLVDEPGRTVSLDLHITDATLTGDNPVARWGDAQRPVSAAQVREWLQAPNTTVVVRPVIDLVDCVPVTAYEVPDRHRRAVELREHSCRFPRCTRPSSRCDLDHARPYGEGGVTCPCNLVPLCRRHHRAKTHSAWRDEVTAPGHYVWTSPTGFRCSVTPSGSRALFPDR